MLGAFSGLLLASVAQAAPVPWINNQTPECQIGDGSNAATAKSFNCADAVAIDATNRKCYVTDREHHRVLRFAYPVTSDQPTAEVVFGQADFTSSAANRGGAIAANTLSTPYGLAVAANGDLWIADYGNNRIVKIPTAYSAASGTAATRVLGQGDFISGADATAGNRLAHPVGLSIDASDNLWVADMSNSRVLRFATVSSAANGASAAQVFGQGNFTSGQINRGGAASSSTLNSPYALYATGTTLWIADSQNNRVLRFNNATGKGNGGAADAVLGQADFTSTTANRGGSAGTSTLSFPAGIAVDDAGELLVSDSFNYRVLIYASATSFANGASATNWINAAPWNIAYDSSYHRLLVARAGGNTVLQFANAYTTTTALTSDRSPSFPGNSVTFTATVTSTTGTPTGTVQFTENTTVMANSTLNALGVATFSTAALADGAHTIVARYLGDATHQCSGSPWYTQEVRRNTPGFTLESSANGAKQAVAVTLTASLAPSSGLTTVPTGTVTFNVDGTDQAPVTLDATGKASWTSATLALGVHPVTVTYAGDADYRALSRSMTQYIDPPEARSVPVVANSERDTKGADTVVYDGTYSAGAVYTGIYDGFTLWPAFRFDLATAPASLVKAELKVHISDKSSAPGSTVIELHGSNDDAWSDLTIPPTAPATIIAAPLASVAANTFASGDWLTFDVTDFIRTQTAGDKVGSFVITAPTAPAEWYLGFHSREMLEYAPVLVVFERPTYSRWATANFTAAELANSAISGVSADPDGTGITNLVRYACGLPARGPVTAPGTATVDTNTNPATATFSFPTCAAAADLSYAVQTSTDLATWTTAGTYATNGTARTVAAPVTAPAGAPRFFIRLQVTLTP
jgi:sugar lactone lactonase YvrE